MAQRSHSSSSSAWPWVIGCGCGAVFLVIISFVLVIFGGAWFVARSVQSNPVEVEAIAHELLPFETPGGVTGRFGFSMMGVKMAFLSADKDMKKGWGIAIIGAPQNYMQPDDLRKQMEGELQKGGQAGVQVGGGQVNQRQEVFTLRGEEIEAVSQVTQNNNGDRLLQYVITIASDDRAVVLMLVAREDEIDHAAVQRFLDTVE